MKIINTTKESISRYGMCGYKNIKNEGFRKKVEWAQNLFDEKFRKHCKEKH